VRGVQDYLVINEVPAGAEALLGKLLNGSTLTVAGAYVCYIDPAALEELDIHLKCTVTGTAPTTSGGSTFIDQSTIRSELIGTGLMVTNVRQLLQMAASELIGSKLVRLIITLPGASSALFTQAEYEGNPEPRTVFQRVAFTFNNGAVAGVYAAEQYNGGKRLLITDTLRVRTITLFAESALANGTLELWPLKVGQDPTNSANFASGPTILTLPTVFSKTDVSGIDGFQIRSKSGGGAGALVVQIITEYM
jgi:hypothetical protein